MVCPRVCPRGPNSTRTTANASQGEKKIPPVSSLLTEGFDRVLKLRRSRLSVPVTCLVVPLRARALPAQRGSGGRFRKGGEAPLRAYLELADAGARAVLVLLSGSATHATRAFNNAV